MRYHSTCPRCGAERASAGVKGPEGQLYRVHLRCDCGLWVYVNVADVASEQSAVGHAFARVAAGPIHGEQRNSRVEVLSSSSTTFVDAAGGEHTLVGSSHEASVSERFCEVCEEWVECGKGGIGLIGHMICKQCGTEWS